MKMTDAELHLFVNRLSRAEFEMNPIVYSKAVRVTLVSLGYDETWVDTDVRELLEKSYSGFFEKFQNR